MILPKNGDFSDRKNYRRITAIISSNKPGVPLHLRATRSKKGVPGCKENLLIDSKAFYNTSYELIVRDIAISSA